MRNPVFEQFRISFLYDLLQEDNENFLARLEFWRRELQLLHLQSYARISLLGVRFEDRFPFSSNDMEVARQLIEQINALLLFKRGIDWLERLFSRQELNHLTDIFFTEESFQ